MVGDEYGEVGEGKREGVVEGGGWWEVIKEELDKKLIYMRLIIWSSWVEVVE